MKKTIFTLLMALVLTMGTALMAQTPATTNDQATDETGQPETGPGPDVDVDTGAEASGAVDVDVNRNTDADTAASGIDETGDLDNENEAAGTTMTDDDNLPDTGSEAPLLGLIGLMALAGACALRASR